MKAPYKRGQKLTWTCDCSKRCGKQVPVTYVKWWGPMRSALIVVRGPDESKRTVHVDDVKPV